MVRTSRISAAAALAALVIQAASPAFAAPSTWGEVKANYRGDAQHRNAPPLVSPDTQVMPPDEGEYTSISGGGGHLPIGCGILSETLVAHALTMPGVQAAIDEFENRGYIALPSTNRAFTGCWNNNFTSTVFLGFERPNTSLAQTQAVAPLIIVSSRLLQGGPEAAAATRISAGLVYMDSATNTMRMADELPMFAASDPCFDVHAVGGGGDPDPGIIHANSTGFLIAFLPEAKIRNFMNCAGPAAAGCVGGAAVSIAATGGLAALAAVTPQALLTIAVGCLGVSVLSCGGALL